LLCLLGMAFSPLNSQVPLLLNQLSTENFNSIGTTAGARLPAGWRMSPAGQISGGWAAGLESTTHSATSGLPVAPGRYNWGTPALSDRAIGFLFGATYAAPSAIMAQYQNKTGEVVYSVLISFSIERYRVDLDPTQVSFFYSLDGSSWLPVPAGDLPLSAFPAGASTASFESPANVSRTVDIPVQLPADGLIYFRWVFSSTGGSGAQGLGLDDVSVLAGSATPALTAQLQDLLQLDNGIQNQYNEGDVIRYRTVIKNHGAATLEGAFLEATPPDNTTLVPGSVKTSPVAIDDQYTADFQTDLNGTSVLQNDWGLPAPSNVIEFKPTAEASAYAAGTPGRTEAGGSLTVFPDGTFRYTPPSGFFGQDRFTYVASNGNLPNSDAVVTIMVVQELVISRVEATDPRCHNGGDGRIEVVATGGNGPLQYSITGAGGTFQPSPLFTNLPAGSYPVAVKDGTGQVRTFSGNTLLTNPVALEVNGTIADLVYGQAMPAASFTQSGGTGTADWSATGLPDGTAISLASGVVTGSPSRTGTFQVLVTATDKNLCAATKSMTLRVAPRLSNDQLTVVGNTQLISGALPAPPTPHVATALNIRDNDLSDGALATTSGTFATTGGGSIALDAFGRFTYTPPIGFAGTDRYTYTATSNGVSATATILFEVSHSVWYVNNTYGGGNGLADGRSHRPFTNLSAATGASQAGQLIYVHSGSGPTTGAAVLKTGQTLRGAGSPLSLGPLLLPAAAKPTLSGTVTLASQVTVDGLDIHSGTATALLGSGADNVLVQVGAIQTSGAPHAVSLTNTNGTVTIGGGSQAGSTASVFMVSGGTVNLTYSGSASQAANAPLVWVGGGHTGRLEFGTGTLQATGGSGLQFDNADGTYYFNGTTVLNGGDAGIDIVNGSGGTFTFGENTTITNPVNEAVRVQFSAPQLTYRGGLTKNNNAVTGIAILNNSGGTLSFDGTAHKSISSQTAPAVQFTGNGGTTVQFSNNLVLATTTGTGFLATGGGTVSVTGTGNTITAAGGVALNVTNTTIGAGNLVFRSISSNGGGNGIILNSTGNNGGLSVTGANGIWGSGGTIRNTSGPDGANGGNGMLLVNTRNVVLQYMFFMDHSNNAILGTGVRSFSIDRCRFTGLNGSSNSGLHSESVVTLLDAGGDLSFTHSYFSGGAFNTVRIENSAGTAPVISSLLFDNDTLTTMQGSREDVRNTGLLIHVKEGTLNNGIIRNSRIDYWWGNAIHVLSQGAAAATVQILNNYCNNTNGALAGAGGIYVGGGNIDYTIAGNTILNVSGAAISSDRTNIGTLMRGTISGNRIGASGVANSGSSMGTGIFASHHGPGTTTVTIKDNVLRQINGSAAIWGLMGDDVMSGNAGGGRFNLTIQGNNIQESGTAVLTSRMGILVTVGTVSGPPPDNGIGCFNIGGAGALANTITNFNMGTTNENRIRINQRFRTTAMFPGYSGANNDNNALTTYLLGRNIASGAVNSNNVSGGGPGFINTPGGSACAQ